MAIQSLNTGPSLGGNLGQALGTGLSAGLDSLAQAKMQHMQKQQRAQGISAVLGVDPQQAQAYASLPDPLLQTLFKQHMQNQSNQQFENQLYGNQAPQQNQYQQPQQQPQQRMNPVNALQQLRGSFPNAPIPSPEQVQQRMPQTQQQQPQQTAPMNRPIPRGLTPQQYNQFVGQRQKEQAAANSTNKKYLDEAGNSFPIAERMIGLADEMKALRQTGKVASGGKGRILPLWMQNAETQQYAAKANELATLISDNSRGRPSAFRLKIAQTTKPSIEQNLLAQAGLEDSVRKQAQKILGMRDVIEQILEENGGNQPANISALVNRRLKDVNAVLPHSEGIINPVEQSENANQQPQGDSSLAGMGIRNAVGVGKSAISGRIGAIGDVLSSALGAANYATAPFSEEQLGNLEGEDADKARAALRQLSKQSASLPQIPTYEKIQEKIPISFPTSQQASEYIDTLTNGYTKPRNSFEESIQNIGTIAGSLFTGGIENKITNGLSKWLSPQSASAVSHLVLPFQGVTWRKSLSIPVASEAGGRIAQLFGAGPEAEIMSRIIFGSLAAGWGTTGQIADDIAEGFETVNKTGKNILTPVNPVAEELSNYRKSIPHSAPYKKIADEIIGETIESFGQLEKKIPVPENKISVAKEKVSPPKKGNKISLQEYHKGPIFEEKVPDAPKEISASDLVKIKQSANEWYGLGSEPKQPGQKHLPKGARKYVGEVSRIVNKHIEPLALKHPEFGKPLAIAEDMYKAQQSAEYLNKQFAKVKDSTKSGYLTGLGKWAVNGLGKYTLGEGYKIFKHMWSHNVTRKIYLQALQKAAQGNIPELAKTLKKLDDAGKRIQ